MNGPLEIMSQSETNKEKIEAMVNGIPAEKVEKKSLAEIKNGKIVFKQKPISFEKHSETMQETVKFREMLEQRIENRAPPLAAIPEEYRPLIVKLAHESDKSLAVLAKHIKAELIPAQDEDDDANDGASADVSASLPQSTVESAVKSVLERNNYGIDAPSGVGKLPAGLCIWRWEVKEEYRDWLPKAAREKADSRLAERVEAKKHLASLFDAFSQAERDVMLDPKGTAKLPTKDTNMTDDAINVSPAKTNDLDPKESPQQTKKQQKKKANDSENDQQSDAKAGSGRPKKEVDPEKLAKDKEKLEKKAAKAEKDRKEKEAHNKSKSIMANFFGKPKGGSARASPAQESDSGAGPSTSQSDFEKTFKPFVLKKDTEVAPTNWFLGRRAKFSNSGRRAVTPAGRELIVIDDESPRAKEEIIDVDMEDLHITQSTHDISQMQSKDHIASIIKSLPSAANPLFATNARRKFCPPRYNTRTILSQLSEAEMADNPSRVRSLLSLLRNRYSLPAKVLIFVEDNRPGYFGTWTRHSRIIIPRKPFARDPVAVDYACDSGEEWEDEDAGDADDVVEGADDDDGDVASDADSEMGDFLVDDDEVEPGEVATPVEEREADPLPNAFNFPVKRKAEGGERKIGKKRKTVTALIPFATGPCWESDIGDCSYEPFHPFRIQLFNDTPYPIDPFTFTSTPADRPQKAMKDASSTFAVPSLPGHLLSSGSNSTPTASPSSAPAPAAPSVKRINVASAPKTAFPDEHLPTLVAKITSLETGSITFLVDSIYQDLRSHKIKKNAIEAKVKEVGEKSKDGKKVWVLKPVTV